MKRKREKNVKNVLNSHLKRCMYWISRNASALYSFMSFAYNIFAQEKEEKKNK